MTVAELKELLAKMPDYATIEIPKIDEDGDMVSEPVESVVCLYRTAKGPKGVLRVWHVGRLDYTAGDGRYPVALIEERGVALTRKHRQLQRNCGG